MIKILLLALVLTDPFNGIMGTDAELNQVHHEALCVLDEQDDWTAASYDATNEGFLVVKQIVNFETRYLKLNTNGVPVKEASFKIHGKIKELKKISGEFAAGYSTSLELVDGTTVRKSWVWGFNINRARNIREDYLEGVTINTMTVVGPRAYYFAHNGDIYEGNLDTRELFRFPRVIPPGATDASYDSQKIWVAGNGVNFSLLTISTDTPYHPIDMWQVQNKSELFPPGTGFIACDSYFNRTILLSNNTIYSIADNRVIAERPTPLAAFGGISLDRLGYVWYYVGNERALHRDTYDLTSRGAIETTHKINFVEMVKF